MPAGRAVFSRPVGSVAFIVLALVASGFVDGKYDSPSAGEVRMRRGMRRVSRSYYMRVTPYYKTVKENENVEFDCTVSGVTNYYDVSWERQGGKMPHNARTLGRTLSLTNVGKEDAGNYECVVHVWGGVTLRTSPGTLKVIHIDECSSSPCQNGATCEDQRNAYVCHCESGYSGLHCETDIDECSSSPCQNGATCEDQRNGYVCRCDSEYSGVHCETDLSPIPPVPKTAESLEKNFLKRQDASESLRTGRGADREVVVLVDGSGSITPDDFQLGVRGLEELLGRMEPQTSVAVATFSTSVQVSIPFGSATAAKTRVQNIPHENGGTDTLQALEKALELFTNRAKKFPGQSRPRQVFLMTDGQPSGPRDTIENLMAACGQLKAMPAEIFILLVGESVGNLQSFADMASSADRHFYRVRNYNEFVNAVNMIQKYT